MTVQLIDGSFSKQEAYEILRDLIEVKIQFHERKIAHNTNHEEDIEQRENKIKRLKNYLQELKQEVLASNQLIHLSSKISIA